MQTPWIVLVKLMLGSGTIDNPYVPQYFAKDRVLQTPYNVVYSGVLMSGGTVEKSIPFPAGMPQVSDVRIRLADPKRRLRDLLLGQIARRRVIELTLMRAGDSIANYPPVYVGEVADIAFPPASVEITCKDRLFAWLDEPIPAMAIPALYPNILPQNNGKFIPLVWGKMRSLGSLTVPGPVPEGVVPLVHIGDSLRLPSGGGLVDRWAAAITPIAHITVYRHLPVKTPGAIKTNWVVVDPSEYVLSSFSWSETTNPLGPFAMTHSYVDFINKQPPDSEFRADIDGPYSRGEFGILPAVNTPGTALRNPIDFFIGIAYFISRKAGVPTEAFDVEGLAALRTQFESLAYYCDGAITQPITLRSFFGQFLSSFNLQMYANRADKITLSFTHAEDPARPVLSEGRHIVRESFQESLPPEVSNQIQYQIQFNNATNAFENSQTIDLVDQAAAAIAGEPKIATEILDQYFIRDKRTAEAMARTRALYVASGAYRQEFKVPAPSSVDISPTVKAPIFNVVDLAKQIGITHSMGLSPGGYQNREAIITAMVLDLDKLEYRFSTVLREPQPVIGSAIRGRMTMDVGVFQLSGFDLGFLRARTLLMGHGSFTLTGEAVTLSVLGGALLRPTSYDDWEDPTQVNPLRSRIVHPELSIDTDANSAADLQIDSTRPSTINYSQLFMFGFPEPSPPMGQSLNTITVKVVMAYDLGTNTTHPLAQIGLYNAETHAYLGVISEFYHFLFDGGSVSVPKTTVSWAIPTADFASFFSGAAANIFVRAQQWDSAFQDFSPTIHLYIYDCWIEYTYV